MPRRRFASAMTLLVQRGRRARDRGDRRLTEAQQRAADELAVGRDGIPRAEPRVREVPPPVHRHGRDDPGRAVRGGGHDPTARGVLLVDGERERAEPLPRELAVTGGLGILQLLPDRTGATLDAHHPRQHPVRAQAGLDAAGHGVPDRIEARRDLLVGAQRLLVDPGGLGDRQPALVARRQQLRGVVEVEREGARGHPRGLAVAPDEPPADGVVGLLGEHGIIGVERGERHRIRMPRQPGARQKGDAILREGDRVRAVEQEFARRRASRSRPGARHPDPRCGDPAPAAPRRPRRACRARCPWRRASRRGCRSRAPRVRADRSERRRSAKSRPARMGPTVWELEGPTPMENSSNAET